MTERFKKLPGEKHLIDIQVIATSDKAKIDALSFLSGYLAFTVLSPEAVRILKSYGVVFK